MRGGRGRKIEIDDPWKWIPRFPHTFNVVGIFCVASLQPQRRIQCLLELFFELKPPFMQLRSLQQQWRIQCLLEVAEVTIYAAKKLPMQKKNAWDRSICVGGLVAANLKKVANQYLEWVLFVLKQNMFVVVDFELQEGQTREYSHYLDHTHFKDCCTPIGFEVV